MNIKQTTTKLQKALLHRGYIYKIATYQFYSEQQNRLITGYKVTEKHGKKNVELLKTCSQVEVLKWFAEKWKEVNGND
ncbi:MAG: hypothetical protein NC094_11970 [Bacteroidales bacterium]|nr:hypothetical protein [Lachnoclostridium sp.]MCM1385288.1 hypothetical protein [Lachnoclostridium sp.]MCM1466126.1 hypothetical protein [Bacteroidales bacterium]